MRASILNATKMGCYDQCKYSLKKAGIPNGIPLQFMAAFMAGFFQTCTVSPFDIIRTRLMNQPHDEKLYNGFVDCFFKILKVPEAGGEKVRHLTTAALCPDFIADIWLKC